MQAADQEPNIPDELPRAGSRLFKVVVAFWNCIPNRIIAALILVGIASELTLLSQDTPLTQNGASVAFVNVAFVVWFWLTIGLVLNRASKRMVEIRENLSVGFRVGLTTMFVVTLVVATTLYVISWGLFLQTSRFASWEVLRFTFNNSEDLWLYLTEAEPIHLLNGGIIICVLTFGACFLIKPVSKVRHAKADRSIIFNPVWVLCSLVLVFAIRGVAVDMSEDRRRKNLAAVSNCMNPALTLCSSAAHAIYAEPIRPVLDGEELVPLSKSWSPTPVRVLGNHSALEINSSHFQPNTISASNKNEQQTLSRSINSLPSIIMVQIESLRSDVIHQIHQGREISPNINRLASNGLEWTNAYSQSTHSDYADPCVVSSLYPLRTRSHHYYRTNDPWPKHLSYDCLKQAGYSTATISSQNEMWGGMEWFLDTPNLDMFYHPERAEDKHLATSSAGDAGFHTELQSGNLTVGKFPDQHTASVAIKWIQRQAQTGKPFLLNMNLQSSHFPYLMADDVPRPFQPCERSSASDIKFLQYDIEHVETVRNAYFNAIHETDRQVGRIVDQLRQLDLIDDVILVIVGENGEAFHENHIVCHATKPYEPAIHVAAVMYGPSWFSTATEDYPLEHVDLLPTIFRAVGLEPHPNFQGIDALAKARPALDERFLFCHVNSPASTADALQWAGRWKYLWDHMSQCGELYDLKNDTGEENNLVAEMPELARALHNQLFNWRNRQLAWYHYPAYYRNFYPPQAPAMAKSDLESIRKYLTD